MTTDPRRQLPSIDALLAAPAVTQLLAAHPRALVVKAARAAVDQARENGGAAPPEGWDEAVSAAVRRLAVPSLAPVINATGVVLHTNLGRAPLAAAAIAAITRVAQGYSAVEYDLGRGTRGSRHAICRDLLVELTGAADAMVVNNAAGALLLALSALARGGDAIVSRGELVEIGGSFRIPDIMARSGARVVEVGTTNRTHPNDYDRALTADSSVRYNRAVTCGLANAKGVGSDSCADLSSARGRSTGHAVHPDGRQSPRGGAFGQEVEAAVRRCAGASNLRASFL